ncbi:hypothetical protein Ndes2526B_g08068 [Nannochloris sp. 'desiccata']
MTKLSYAFALISIIASVSAQTSTVAPMGCDVTKVCGGPLKVAASVVIGPKEINGNLVDFFACECLNGTRAAVSKDGTIIIPLNDAPAAAPAAAPATAPVAAPVATPAVVAAAAPTASTAFDAAAYAATLKSTYPTLCARVNVTLLSDPLTNPTGCRRPIKLGEVCWSSCRATLRGIGQSCYAIAVAKGAADPTLVGSNTTVAYTQCTRGVPYTTIANWVPEATGTPPPTASPPDEGRASPPPPTESATPAASAAWKPAVFATVPLVSSLFATILA